VFSYLYELRTQLEVHGFSNYLWEVVVRKEVTARIFLVSSAEEKAADRVIASESEEIDWIDIDYEEGRQTPFEGIEAYLKKRGYSWTFSD